MGKRAWGPGTGVQGDEGTKAHIAVRAAQEVRRNVHEGPCDGGLESHQTETWLP